VLAQLRYGSEYAKGRGVDVLNLTQLARGPRPIVSLRLA